MRLPSLFARRGFLLGAALVGAVVLAAACAHWLAPFDPVRNNYRYRLGEPNGIFLLGTDRYGRDVFSRILFGARVSLGIGFSVAVVSGLAGGLAGLAAGWWRRADPWIMRVMDGLMAFPGVLLAIALAASLGPGLGNVIIALVITGWAGYARLARAQVLKVKEMDYVAAARSLGASDARIVWRHVLPNTIQPVLIQATIGMASAILAESTLSFLGLGVLAPTPSWGAMLNDARNHLFDAPHMIIFPALGIMAAVLAFNLLGDALRDWLDPRTRSFLITQDLAR